MQLELTRSNFHKALNLVGRIASNKTPLEILNNILIKAVKNQIIIAATDLEVAISAVVPGKVLSEGSITIPARLLSEYVASVPEGNMKLELDKTNLKISCGRYKSTLNGVVADEFPELPTPPESGNLKLNSSDLLRALQQTLLTVSHDTTRPVLTGVYLNSQDNKINLAATDGYRLAERKLDINSQEINCIVPSGAMNDLLRILQDSNDEITLNYDESQIAFTTEKVTLVSRLIDGEYPPYQQLIPAKSEVEFKVSKSELANITKVASLFARESAGSITIFVDKNEVKITSIASQMGENTSSAEAKTTGTGEVTLNSRYLLDALGCLDGDEISFRFSGKISPCVLTAVGQDNYQHIIMPLKS